MRLKGWMALAIGIVAGFVVLLVVFSVLSSPRSAIAIIPTAAAETTETLTEATAESLFLGQFSVVNGENLDGDTLTMPIDFSGELNLIVMPFDRNQQSSAINWLLTFQAIIAQHPQVNYYSIAALENLAPAIRFLVVQGLNVAVTDTEVRERTFVLFLENQQSFVDALGDGDMSEMRVLIVNREGQVLWQYIGTFSETAGFQIQAAIDEFLKR